MGVALRPVRPVAAESPVTTDPGVRPAAAVAVAFHRSSVEATSAASACSCVGEPRSASASKPSARRPTFPPGAATGGGAITAGGGVTVAAGCEDAAADGGVGAGCAVPGGARGAKVGVEVPLRGGSWGEKSAGLAPVSPA